MRANGNRRGFVFAVIMVFLSISLVGLALVGAERGRESLEDRVEFENVVGAAYVFDDVAYDLGGESGLLSAFLGSGKNATHFWFYSNFSIPGNYTANFTSAYSGYNEFLRDVYTNRTHANVSSNFSTQDASCVYLAGGGACYVGEKITGNTHETIVNWSSLPNESSIEISVACDGNATEGPYATGFSAGGELTISYTDPNQSTSFGPYGIENLQSAKFKSYYPPGRDMELEIDFSTSADGKGIILDMRIPSGHEGEVNCTISERVSFAITENTSLLVSYMSGTLNYTQAGVNRTGTMSGEIN